MIKGALSADSGDWEIPREELNSDRASSMLLLPCGATMQRTGVQKTLVDDAVTEEMSRFTNDIQPFLVDYWEWSVSDAIVPTSPYPSPQQESGTSGKENIPCDHELSPHSLADVPRPGQPATHPPIQVSKCISCIMSHIIYSTVVGVVVLPFSYDATKITILRIMPDLLVDSHKLFIS